VTTPVASIVLPCYNEREHVMQEIKRISAAMDDSKIPYELIVIDDGSTDGTREVLAAAAKEFPAMRFMPFNRNGGSGTARRIGTREARGEIVVWTDADMTYPNERIPEFVQHLLDDDSVDQVVGARTSEEGTYKILRVPAKWVIRRIASYLTNTEIPDLNSGLRAFRREASLPYLNLLPPGFSCVTTLTVAFLSNQLEVQYVPIDYAKRAGKSKFHPLRDAYRYILQVLRMVMYFNPIKVLMPLALWIIGLGIVKLAVDLVRYNLRVTGSTVLAVVIGLQIAALALIGDLIVRSRTRSD
jgi:polyisoprenyl-phosphate glycosyltransferase